jgi:2-polyprenyl-3-methyl-5-hydroxy-6-metoxy-1,4-benzoquinol methylase
MNSLETLKNKKFDSIFFIASFHHLQTIDERIEVLRKVKKLLNKDGKIFLTNWSLASEFNKDKYEKSMIVNSENQF